MNSKEPEFGCPEPGMPRELRFPRDAYIEAEVFFGSNNLEEQDALRAQLSGMSDQQLLAREEERRSRLSFQADSLEENVVYVSGPYVQSLDFDSNGFPVIVYVPEDKYEEHRMEVWRRISGPGGP